jgi:hypothetical protein
MTPAISTPTTASQGAVSPPTPSPLVSTSVSTSAQAPTIWTPAGSGHPSILVIVRVANGAVLPLLRSGDQVIAGSTRGQTGAPVTASSPSFSQAIAALERVGSGQSLVKNLSLSSVDDLNSVKSSIPADIQYVTYSMEEGITPPTELNAAPTVVPQYASIVHSLGKRMVYIPTRVIFDKLQASNSLKTMLPSIDGIGYQAQRLFNIDPNLISHLQAKYQYVKSVNPSTLFMLQLWIGINGATTAQIRDAFNQLTNYMDVAIIGTSSDQASTLAVLSDLSWRK